MPVKVSEKQIAEAIIANHGWLTHAARDLGVTYNCVYARVQKSKRLQRVQRETAEINLDEMEDMLRKFVIEDRNPASVMFYLKCKGKSRGWKEKEESEINTDIQETLSKLADRLPQ